MEAQLGKLGYSATQIAKMTPEKAWGILYRPETVAPEVTKLTMAEEQELRGLKVIIANIQNQIAKGVESSAMRAQLESSLARQTELTSKVPLAKVGIPEAVRPPAVEAPVAPKVAPKPTLTQQVREIYSDISAEVKATQVALKGLTGIEAQTARQTLKILDIELKNLDKILQKKAPAVPEIGALRQTIMAWSKFKGLSMKATRDIFSKATGKTSLTKMTEPQLRNTLTAIKDARPVRIRNKKVITNATENKIQSLRSTLEKDGLITADTVNQIIKDLKLSTTHYENQYRFITEPEGKALIRAINDEAELGFSAWQSKVADGLNRNPAVKKVYDEYGKRIEKEAGVFLEGKKLTDASILKDQRFAMEDLQTRTGEPFYDVYFKLNRVKNANRMRFNALKRRQVSSTPEFKKLFWSKKSMDRINNYIAAKNKWMKVQSPKDITSEEIKLANALEEQLYEFVPDYRFHRFLNFYNEYNGNISKIAEGIPDAPKADLKVAIDIYESQGAGRLKAYLDTRTWGIIESGFEPHYIVNPKLAQRQLRIAFPTGRFKARSGAEFYVGDMNVVQRVDRYTQQMLSYNLKPYIRRMEVHYQKAIPKLKNPDKIRRGISAMVNEMMGYRDRSLMGDLVMRIASQAYITVFGTFPVLPFRNLFQNLAFAPDKSVLVDPRNRSLSEWDWEMYHTHISQMEAIPRDLLLAEGAGIPGLQRVNRFIVNLNLYGASDSKANRVWCYWGYLNKAERALTQYKKDGNIEKFIANSGMAEMTLTQQKYVLENLVMGKVIVPGLTEKAGEYGAISEIGLEITNNVHFLYDRAQRAWVEMGELGQIMGSLVVFPRSVAQRLAKQIKVLDPAGYAPSVKKKRAMRTLLAMVLGGMAAGYLFNKATGRERNPYNPLNILVWTPGGLALGAVTNLFELVGDIIMACQGDKNAISRLPGSIESAGDTFIPFYKLIISSLESAVDKKYLDRLIVREIRSIIEKKLVEMGFLDKAYEPNREFYEAERSWEWKIKHALWSTEPPPPDPIVKAVEDITEAQAQLGQFVMAEDSDDGYVYTMSDFGASIRNATQSLNYPKDITTKNGFSDIVLMYKNAEVMWNMYYYSLPSSERIAFREREFDISAQTEAYLFLWGKLSVLRNDASLAMVEALIKQYGIPEGAVVDLDKVRGKTAPAKPKTKTPTTPQYSAPPPEGLKELLDLFK